MSRFSSLAATLLLFAIPVSAQPDPDPPALSGSDELPAGVTKAIELMKSTGFTKTLFYAELDDRRPDGRPILRSDVVGSVTNVPYLLKYTDEQEKELLSAIGPEMPPGGEWRSLAIVVEGGRVMVAPGPRAGSLEDFPVRLRALVDREFPGHP